MRRLDPAYAGCLGTVRGLEIIDLGVAGDTARALDEFGDHLARRAEGLRVEDARDDDVAVLAIERDIPVGNHCSLASSCHRCCAGGYGTANKGGPSFPP